MNESSQKAIINTRDNVERQSNKSLTKFVRVTHYQPEFNAAERELQDKIGVTCAQVVYFTLKLCELTDDYVKLEDGGII